MLLLLSHYLSRELLFHAEYSNTALKTVYLFSHHFWHGSRVIISPHTGFLPSIYWEKNRAGKVGVNGMRRRLGEFVLRVVRSSSHRWNLSLTICLEGFIWDLPTALSQKPHCRPFICISSQNEWWPSLQHLSQFFLYKVSFPSFLAKKFLVTLTGMAQWVGCCPANGKFASLIPRQGTCRGCGPGPLVRATWEATNWCFSPSFSLPFSLSKNK